MSTDHSYVVELDSSTNTTLKVYLYKNVQNVEDIRSNIVKGSWKCAVVKPTLILDPFQLAVAANRAVLAEKLESMVTRTVFAEILFNLSLSKNISQSLTKFGVENGQELLVCFLVTPKSDDSKEIITQIDGELCSISELANLTNLKVVQQVYKLNDMQCVDNNLLDIVVSKMATKSFVSY